MVSSCLASAFDSQDLVYKRVGTIDQEAFVLPGTVLTGLVSGVHQGPAAKPHPHHS